MYLGTCLGPFALFGDKDVIHCRNQMRNFKGEFTENPSAILNYNFFNICTLSMMPQKGVFPIDQLEFSEVYCLNFNISMVENTNGVFL